MGNLLGFQSIDWILFKFAPTKRANKIAPNERKEFALFELKASLQI